MQKGRSPITRLLSGCAALFLGVAASAQEHHHEGPAAVVVTGTGKVSAAPDRAIVTLGATFQAREAATAQKQVNEIMQRALQRISELGVPKNAIRTAGLQLSPVYSDRSPIRSAPAPEGPQIVGYRASNSVRVQLDDLDRLGTVIDAGIASGANEVGGIAFQLRDDTAERNEALRQAVVAAKGKAGALADGLGIRLGKVLEVREADSGGFDPQPRMMRMAAMESSTPVQPGQISVEATVTVRFEIRE